MIPFGVHTFAQSFDGQGSNKENTTYKYPVDEKLLLGLTYDFENPIYAKEGILSKMMKRVKNYISR